MSPVDMGPFVAAMDTAMAVVTATRTDTGERAGCLVGFLGQCSIDPPRLMAWMSRVNHTYGVATGATHLAVHLVPDDPLGRQLGERFGGETGDDTDKFSGLGVDAGPGQVPLLRDLPWRLVGEVIDLVDVGSGTERFDHVGFVLRPVSVTDPEPAAPALLRLRQAEHIAPGHPAG